jgi:hypothetical protein
MNDLVALTDRLSRAADAAPSENFLANSSSFALLVFFLCCVVLKVRMRWPLDVICKCFMWVPQKWLCVRVCLCIPLVCSPLQVGTLTELRAVRDVVSEEQKRDFQMSTLALSIGLLASAVFTLAASSASLLVQLGNERVNMRLLARSAKERRLCRRSSGDEVKLGPPVIRDNHPPSFDPTHVMFSVSERFHVFLSHVWG